MPVAVDTTVAARLRLSVARLARMLRQHTPPDGDVTVSMLSALASVERLGPLTLGELAGFERVQPPSMTKIVARLDELGLVAREVDSADRRVARVRLTPEGWRFLNRNRARRNEFLAERMRNLTPDEVAVLRDALPVLEKLVEEDL